MFCKVVLIWVDTLAQLARAHNTFWVVGSSPACVSKEEFLPIYNMNWITRIIYLVYKLCYLKKGMWLNSNTGGSIPSQFYSSKEEIN